MTNKQTKTKSVEVVPILSISVDKSVEQETWSPDQAATRYVVVRGGIRVSDKDYSKSDEQIAVAEKEFWQKVVKRWPDGTKVEIVKFDKKKHRIW